MERSRVASAGGDPWLETVERCADWLEASGTDDARAQAAEVRARVRDARVVVGVIGQFKRGKTSLVNAWVDTDLLPVGVLPTTGVPTRVRRGDRAGATVRFTDGGSRTIDLADIVDYASEARNPGNRLQVRDIVVESVSPGLPPWLEVVDTPGIGSTLTQATELALSYLPWIDLGLFVLSPEPPLTEGERSYLVQAREHAAKLAVVLTKSDTAPADALEAIVRFARAEIAQATGAAMNVHLVSTVDADARRRTRAILDRIVREQSQLELIRRGTGRRLRAFLAAQLGVLSLQAAAWQTPARERRARAERMALGLEQLARIQADQPTLWQAARRHAADQVDCALGEAKVRLLADLAAFASARTDGYARVRDALAAQARQRLDGLRDRFRIEAQDIGNALVRRRLASLNAEVGRLVDDAADLLGTPRIAFEITLPVAEDRSFYFRWDDDPSLLPDLRQGALYALLPGGAGRARQAALAAVAELVDRNVGRLSHAFRSAVEATLEDAASHVGRQLESLIAAFGQALHTLRSPPDPASAALYERLRARIGEGEALVLRLEGAATTDVSHATEVAHDAQP